MACMFPLISVPVSIFVGQYYGSGEDVYGFGVLMAMIWSYLVGVGISWLFIICGWVKGEYPRFLAVVAIVIGLLPLYWVH